MAKLLVKDPRTGNTRPMTQKSYDLVNKKRGFKIVGHEEDNTEKSPVRQEMDRLRAEQASKQQLDAEPQETETAKEEQPTPTERKKPGPKPKSKAE